MVCDDGIMAQENLMKMFSGAALARRLCKDTVLILVDIVIRLKGISGQARFDNLRSAIEACSKLTVQAPLTACCYCNPVQTMPINHSF